MFEFSLPRLADTTCIWTALKMQRKPHGMIYMGSLLIPFLRSGSLSRCSAMNEVLPGLEKQRYYSRRSRRARLLSRLMARLRVIGIQTTSVTTKNFPTIPYHGFAASLEALKRR